MNWVLRYWESIESGEIIVGHKIRTLYGNMIREMGDDTSPYFFDRNAGEYPIRFIEGFCKQAEGEMGAPIELDLWQKAFIQALFGWKIRATGFRRYTEALLLVGRKNGKTTLLAAIALYMSIADGEGAAECYSVATKKDQAAKAFKAACNMRAQSPEIAALTKKRRTDIYIPANLSFFEALASDSDTLDGLNSHLVIVDELHAIRDRNLYDVMKQSMSSRRQPLLVAITTAGKHREGIFDAQYDYAQKVLVDPTVDPRFLPVLYELDEPDEWEQPENWVKTNPGLGTIKQYTTLAEFVKKGRNDPTFLPTVLCKDFNLRSTGSEAWLTFSQLDNLAEFDIADLENSYCIGGCDLSATTDLTCATLLLRRPDDDMVYVLQHYFIPEARIKALDETASKEAPYRIWAKRGLLTICNGNRVNYHQVTEWFVKMRDVHQLYPMWICYDRALAGYWVNEMEDEAFTLEQTPQGPYTWSYPMKDLGAALADKRVNYNNNPVLKWCLSNVGKKSTNKDGVESIQPVKLGEGRRIDGMVSLLNAWVGYTKHYDDYMNMI